MIGAQTGQLQLVGVFFLLSVAPLVVIMCTSFTKFSIVLTLLRSALGVQQAPGNLAISGLALAATLVVMAPTLHAIGDALSLDERVESGQLPPLPQMIDAVRGPLGEFMLAHSRPAERAFLLDAAKRTDPARDAQESDFTLLVPAFLISEISSGFEAGFLLYIAFLVIDLVVANVLTAMGMMMLSPSTVSIPLKLFVLVAASGIPRLMHALILGYAK
ncbi:EscR/YscR/HrcR family type III secretion system export apparatus protein [Caballeronia sp. LP006]|jgi:type III secretion protein R|uniref:EscR/YscR/HrcR family type III secretion system export apparatus protein n=1 Tax=unclassified Caballeronia TaxID=2646786 RepID=UPI001FD3B591|nr:MULTISPECIES: EscR/YscR/HrcR family type III secretion system export apparatus protein [unclassified Caballeronia]MDR5775879.1 EscR/YscR/HrcR family type III secretion system export apparatus protein [Caballeronia sp. LZ002]MDR5828594.1 EscR/YscR/HrcR family type III secretion system export apparatus protein [Caballeronia sp. LP006]MDR5851318.1 EscR/YscR/HrcR family type III secretion system export apparatus protein [Caballeronia sp. LZ003]